tara:strand:+ start:666 stop:917 length:252 start_codon:yes stop_codon:yes gene_type:complete
MSNTRSIKKFVSANFSVDCTALNAENSARFVNSVKSNKQRATSNKRQAAGIKRQAASQATSVERGTNHQAPSSELRDGRLTNR